MKSIEDAQSKTIHDTCTHCGSFVDIGAVIEENDTQLVVNFVGDTAKSDAEQLAQKASQKFKHVQSSITETEDGVDLALIFSVSAEKMIFQLQNRL